MTRKPRAESSRRVFLKRSATTLGATALGATFGAYLSAEQSNSSGNASQGYGSLRPVKDEATGLELLWLPEGFTYRSYGWTGDALDDGTPTPSSHDGMAVVKESGGQVLICRNHERKTDDGSFGAEPITYDPRAGGGTLHILFDAEQGEWVKAWPSLAGTIKNCAGGPTPWGSWLSCEETTLGPGDVDDEKRFDLEETHGWIFEVPADGATTAEPLRGMGRFVHEAIAVDPETGYVYETEDRENAGFYRFLPDEAAMLAAGGRLQMLRAAGATGLRKGSRVGQVYDVDWVDIEDPTRAHSPGQIDHSGVFSQGKQQRATTFARLEGCWQGNARIYFNATSGGMKGLGQIWEFDPAQQQLKLIFESPSADVLDSPDNIAVSPRGGLVLCEDGDIVPQRLHGLTPEGQLFPFAANNIVLRGERNGFRGDFRGEEWAGATFTSDGIWLFVNIQTPGITFAITGPWGESLL